MRHSQFVCLFAMCLAASLVYACKGGGGGGFGGGNRCIPHFVKEENLRSDLVPSCGPRSGGTVVEVTLRDSDGEVFPVPDGVKVISVTLRGHESSALETVDEVVNMTNGFSFETPGWTYEEAVDVIAEVHVKGKFKGTRQETGKACESEIDGEFKVKVGEFEYIDVKRPILSDGDTTFDLDGACVLNPKPGQGHSCGGYAVEIVGGWFDEDCSVAWGGRVLEPDEYRRSSATRIEVTVPPGTMSSMVGFSVTNPPKDCAITSLETGCFWYTQDECGFTPITETSVVVPDVNASGPIYLATGSVIAGPEIDVVTVQETTTPPTGSLRLLEGVGDGRLLRSMDPGRAFNFSEGIPRGVELGHFDGDMFLDAVVALELSGGGGRISIFHNDGSGYLDVAGRVTTVDVGTRPTELVVADLDGDGDHDVLVGSVSNDELIGLTQTGPRVLDVRPTIHLSGGGGGGFFTTTLGLVAGDYDRTGSLDIAVLSVDGVVEIFSSGADTIWSPTAPGWVSSLDLGTGFDASFARDLVEPGDNFLVLSQSPTEVLHLDVDAAAGGALPSAPTRWPLVHSATGAIPSVLTVGHFKGTTPIGVAVGYEGGHVVVLLNPDPLFLDGRATSIIPAGDFTDIAADFLNSDDPTSLMDVVCGIAGSPPRVQTLVNTW